jgi:lipopolysaccharide export system permease protein
MIARLHDRMVIGLWLRVMLYCIAGFAVLFVLGDLFEKIDDFIDHQAPTPTIVRYYLFRVPEIVRLTLPVDVLLSTLFTLGVLGKNNEIVALLASGVSMLRVSRPIVLAALVCVGVSALLAEKIVPEANLRASRIQRVEIDKQPPIDAPIRAEFKYRGRNGYYYAVRLLDTRAQRMTGVVLHQVRDGHIVTRLDADAAEWVDDHWVFRNGFLREFTRAEAPAAEHGAPPPVLDERALPFHQHRLYDLEETPDDLARIEPEPDAMNYTALRGYVDRIRQSGGDSNDYVVEMYTKLSYPWTSLVLAFLGVGLSARKKKASLATGFGQTLVIAFAYLALTEIGASLGKNERLPALFAAWVGNLLFGIAAAILMVRANR